MVRKTQFFDAFNNLNVLILGDVMIDRYLTGSVTRISPEAPVPVVHLQGSSNRLGGAANVALNIKALGATPYLCSVIGQDDKGRTFLDLLPQNDLSDKGIIALENRVTTVKTRVMAAGQQLLRVDEESTTDLEAKEEGRLLERIRHLLDSRDIHVILFQDYNKGVLTYRIIREVMLEAVKRDIPTAVDPKFKNFWAYKHASLFKPNLKEIRAQLPEAVEVQKESLKRAAEQIRRKLDNQYTLITLSEQGLFYDTVDTYDIIPTQPRSIADVCGAGDTVISIASLGLALRLEMYEIALLSNLAGGQVCERIGVVPVDKAQLKREYESLK